MEIGNLSSARDWIQSYSRKSPEKHAYPDAANRQTALPGVQKVPQFNLKAGGMASWGLSDGTNVTVYKPQEYTVANPVMRVVTTTPDGQEKEELINANEVDLTDATQKEMFAVNAYLVDAGKMTDDDRITASGMFGEQGAEDLSQKHNFISLAKGWMKLEYQAQDLSSYLNFKKLAEIYETFKNTNL